VQAGKWLIFLCCLTLHSEPMIAVDESSNGHQVVLHEGQVLKVSLNENATTGFRWTVHAKPEVLRESEATEAPTGPPGSGGVRHFYFEALHPGSGEIELEYRRSWEQTPRPARSFKLRIKVRK
jgi:inhibitor of cysteine peptidase